MGMNRFKYTAQLLAERVGSIAAKRATVGFDGYTDELLHVVEHRQNAENYQPFQTIKDFGTAIAGNAGSSGLEIVTKAIKVGGNGPILAEALARLGLPVTCVGLFGWPETAEVFSRMSPNCELISMGQPAHTLAFEFTDGKLMFGRHENLNDITWKTLVERVGVNRLRQYYAQSDLVGITNWSEMIHANDLWNGILLHCMPQADLKRDRYIFFDLADPIKRAERELQAAVELIEGFGPYGKTVLGLNLKEAGILYRVLYGEDPGNMDFLQLGPKIKEKLAVNLLCLHSARLAAAFEGDAIHVQKCLTIKTPKLLTGCGDNFNAGLSLGLLMALPLDDCLSAGICTAAYYIENGYSATVEQLIAYMLQKGDGAFE